MAQPATSTRRLAVGTTGASSASQTIVQTAADEQTPSGILRLRASPTEQRRIQWAEDVVDNEGMGKKSSKVCCIYHKPGDPSDSESDTSSGSSSSDSDSEPDLSRAQNSRKRGGRGSSGKGKGKGKERKPSPNAYERQPKPKSKTES